MEISRIPNYMPILPKEQDAVKSKKIEEEPKGEPKTKVEILKQQIENGTYKIDIKKTAEAIANSLK